MLLSATTLRGLKVINYDNEDLGTIEDFLPDSETGRPGYAVLSCAGGPGNGKLFAVPVRALAVAVDGVEFILNADREMLKERARLRPAFLAGHPGSALEIRNQLVLQLLSWLEWTWYTAWRASGAGRRDLAYSNR